MGRAVIMGRATWESLPRRPLPGRRNIVVTCRGDYIAEGADTAKSVAEAVALCAPKERPVIIGGASIYEAALPYCDILNITRIKAIFPDADTYFPAIQENFWEVIQEDGPFTSKTGLRIYIPHTASEMNALKVVIINKSDSTGGAAVVSFRLMNALRTAGVDARMLVAEKLTDSPFVEAAGKPWQLKCSFLAERLKIFLANGLNRKTLFKIDTGSDGVPLHKHPAVMEADVICLNWVNQGLLSLKEAERITALGKPVVWTMHDMWNMTGICHHAALCDRFSDECGCCPLLGHNGDENDLSRRVQLKKASLRHQPRRNAGHTFVAVSNWLAERSRHSTLLRDKSVSVIPNAFPFAKGNVIRRVAEDGEIPHTVRRGAPRRPYQRVAGFTKSPQSAVQAHSRTGENVPNWLPSER